MACRHTYPHPSNNCGHPDLLFDSSSFSSIEKKLDGLSKLNGRAKHRTIHSRFTSFRQKYILHHSHGRMWGQRIEYPSCLDTVENSLEVSSSSSQAVASPPIVWYSPIPLACAIWRVLAIILTNSRIMKLMCEAPSDGCLCDSRSLKVNRHWAVEFSLFSRENATGKVVARGSR